MKKLMGMAIILALAAPVCSLAADTPMRMVDQVVVDRTTRNKHLNDYIFLIRDLIQRSWTTPVDIAVPGAVKGRIRINYVITRSGALKSAQLVTGSGNAELDRTLLEAIRLASPFPPFPEHVNARSMLVRANFIVADVPTLPVTRTQHTANQPVLPEIVSPVAPSSAAQPKVDRPQAAGTQVGLGILEQKQKHKKLIWGVPAGTGATKQPTVSDEPAPRTMKKLKWGR